MLPVLLFACLLEFVLTTHVITYSSNTSLSNNTSVNLFSIDPQIKLLTNINHWDKK